MPNRALQAKADRAKTQRVLAGIQEGNKFHEPKSVLRSLAAVAYLVPKNCNQSKPEPSDRQMVLYNPRQPQRKKAAMWAAMVACDGELVKNYRRG